MINHLRQFMVRHRAKSYLESSEDKMMSACEKNALRAFHHAAGSTSYYRKILEANRVNPDKIRTISDFKERIPVIDKTATFIKHKNKLSRLTCSGNIEGVASILSSSGTSNAYSFGLLTPEDMKLGPDLVDFGLDINFGVFKKKTLLINCLPMGVKVPSNHCVVADVSVRKDTTIALVDGFADDFDLTIIVGENSFIKEVLEFGIEKGINWKDHNVRIVIGEEGFPENFRAYLGYLLGYDHLPDTDVIIGSSMGISELGLTVFQENKHTIRLRKFIDENKDFRSELFGPECQLCPMLFVYYPMTIYLEEDTSSINPDHIGNDLIFTKLDRKSKIPLIRYLSGDRGKIVRHSAMASLLRQYQRTDLIAPIELPFVAVFERGKLISSEGGFILSEAVKAGIYSNFNLPNQFTGNFKISMGEDQLPGVEIQLKPGIEPDAHLKSSFQNAITHYCKGKFRIRLYSFGSFPYPLDYERKFRYID